MSQDYSGVDEVHIKSTGRIHIRPELNVVQSKTDNDESQVCNLILFYEIDFDFFLCCLFIVKLSTVRSSDELLCDHEGCSLE